MQQPIEIVLFLQYSQAKFGFFKVEPVIEIVLFLQYSQAADAEDPPVDR